MDEQAAESRPEEGWSRRYSRERAGKGVGQSGTVRDSSPRDWLCHRRLSHMSNAQGAETSNPFELDD